jgi:hypothetical protein
VQALQHISYIRVAGNHVNYGNNLICFHNFQKNAKRWSFNFILQTARLLTRGNNHLQQSGTKEVIIAMDLDAAYCCIIRIRKQHTHQHNNEEAV